MPKGEWVSLFGARVLILHAGSACGNLTSHRSAFFGLSSHLDFHEDFPCLLIGEVWQLWGSDPFDHFGIHEGLDVDFTRWPNKRDRIRIKLLAAAVYL